MNLALDPAELAGIATCFGLLILTGYGAGKWTNRRKREGRR